MNVMKKLAVGTALFLALLGGLRPYFGYLSADVNNLQRSFFVVGREIPEDAAGVIETKFLVTPRSQ